MKGLKGGVNLLRIGFFSLVLDDKLADSDASRFQLPSTVSQHSPTYRH